MEGLGLGEVSEGKEEGGWIEGEGGAMEGRLRFTVYRERSGKTFVRKTGIWDCNWGRVRVSEDETSPGCVWMTDT